MLLANIYHTFLYNVRISRCLDNDILYIDTKLHDNKNITKYIMYLNLGVS